MIIKGISLEKLIGKICEKNDKNLQSVFLLTYCKIISSHSLLDLLFFPFFFFLLYLF